MNDAERFANAITALAESFRQKATPGMFHGYRLGMQGVPIDAVERAAALALQRCKFMPVPAELRELAGASGTSYEAMAEKAFHTLTKAVRQLGPDSSVNFADGAINAAVRLLGGWIRVCDLPREEFDKWLRKDFIATYVRVCKDGASEDLRSYHGGRLERDNAAWEGRTLPGGGVYRIGMFGSEVNGIDVDYVPALPAPEPKRQIAARADVGFTPKLITESQL